jgi:hypothetical protein
MRDGLQLAHRPTLSGKRAQTTIIGLQLYSGKTLLPVSGFNPAIDHSATPSATHFSQISDARPVRV